MNMFKEKKRMISMLLVLVLLLTVIPPVPAEAAAGEDFIRVYHLDVGRKYFTVEQVTGIIDALAANGYTHLELAIGNNGLRFLLDDMTITVGSVTYTSDNVKAGIRQGNVNYAHAGELSEAEMDSIIAYADSQNIGIIPLVNTPGHMNAILDAAEYVGISNPAYGTTVSSGWWGSTSTKYSASTVSLSNSAAVGFTQALVQKYVDYFASKGCAYFNMGADEYANDVHSSGSMGFGAMQSGGWYDDFVNYVNELTDMIRSAGMNPIAFNDGIYFNSNAAYTFDSDLIIALWTAGWGSYSVASAEFLVDKGHMILNTNDAWYYVLGRNGQSDGYGYYSASNGVSGTSVTNVPGGVTLDSDTLIGAMSCLWCDTPSASYDSNRSNVMNLIETWADSNPDYFVVNTHEHTYETVTIPATCTTGGYTASTCTVCGVQELQEETAAMGHSYTSVTTAPTCTEQGYTSYTCADCGLLYTDDHVDALGHSYNVTEDGSTITYTCDRCGHSYRESSIRYQQVSSMASDSNYVITLYSGGSYYALSHRNNSVSAVKIEISGGEVVSGITDDLIWSYSGSKLSYQSGGTTYYLYASSNSWWGGWWGSSATLTISTGSSSTVSFSGNALKVGSYYLRYSNGTISPNRSATTCYVFLETRN